MTGVARGNNPRQPRIFGRRNLAYQGPTSAAGGMDVSLSTAHSGDFAVSTTGVLVPPKDIVLPEGYSSAMSTEDKIDIAMSVAEQVNDIEGLEEVKVISSSVTGSRLRGLDTESSDTDILVMVENLPGTKKSRDVMVDDLDVRVQDLGSFIRVLSTSVPYVDFLKSPFRCDDPAWSPMLRSYHVDPFLFEAHAQRFARNNSHNNITPEKRARLTTSTLHLLETGSPLCPRRLYDVRGEDAAHVHRWLSEVWQGHEEDHNDKSLATLDILERASHR